MKKQLLLKKKNVYITISSNYHYAVTTVDF